MRIPPHPTLRFWMGYPALIAMDLAADVGIGGRIEVWDIRQFLSANIFEHGLFDEAKRNSTLSELIDRYNEIISEVETDPGLRIEIESKNKRKGKIGDKRLFGLNNAKKNFPHNP